MVVIMKCLSPRSHVGRHGKKVTRFIVVTAAFTLFLLVFEELLFITTLPTEHPMQQTEMRLPYLFAGAEKQTHLPNQVSQENRSDDETFPGKTTNPSYLNKKTDRMKTGPSCPKSMSAAKCKMYDKIVHHFTMKESDKRDDLINLHRYDYVIDSTACQRESPQVVLLVHSKFDHHHQRDDIRSTWAHNRTVLGLRVATVFVLGLPAAKKNKKNVTLKLGAEHQQTLQRKDVLETLARNVQEAKRFKDIVVGNFTDSYRNLTRKHVMALGWVLSHCPKVKYIVKLDDDVIVNVYNLARHIKQTYRSARKIIVCRVPKNPKVQRKNASKWSVSTKEYPFSVYPPYCLGFGIFMTQDIAKRLYETTRDVRPFWIDDVYMTGLVAWKAGVALTDFHGNLTVSLKNIYHKQHKNAMFVFGRFKNKETYRTYWRNLVAAES